MKQGTQEWHNVRIGKITASRISGLNAKPKTGKALNATMLELLAERITGEQTENYVTPSMQWGIDNEPLAKRAYESEVWCNVVDVGFIPHPTIEMSGASPDGLVGDDGLIEIKCPNTQTHLNTLLTGKVPSEYLPQITWQMACTGRKWCDFVSFDPRLPSNMRIKIIRVNRDDVDIESLEKLAISCNDKLIEIIESLN